MAEFSISCSSCQAGYALPENYRQALEGRAVFCVACQRWWVALPSASGPPVRLVKGRPERAPVDLRQFQRGDQAPPANAPPANAPPAQAPPAQAPPVQAPPANAPAGTSSGLDATARVPTRTAAAEPVTLRLAVSTPGKPGKDVKAVFDLGARSFLIGQKGCHLNLKQAQIPARAIRVRSQGAGFHFEGIDGFAIPIGSISIDSGQIEPGGSVRFHLPPFEVLLETSTTPGRPIADLEKSVATVRPTPPASSPAPAPPPVAPAPPEAPPSPTPPRMAGSPAAPDLRQQIQDFAIDVRPDQNAFAEQQDAVQEALDGDATITDLGARGFQAARFGNPLAGLDLSLVRAEGATQGQAFKISKSPVVIGRKEGDMIVHDGRVSSKHAQLDVAGPRIYTLKDLASTNGTTVNDRPISVGHLEDGDVISFGGVKFEFRAKMTG